MRIFPAVWQRNFLLFEGLVVLVFGVADLIYGYHCGGNEALESALSSRGSIYSVLVPAFVSLFGFVIAATSIIVGVSGEKRLAVVWEHEEGWQDLWNTLFSAIRWLGVAALVALAALVFDRSDSPTFWLAHAVLILTAMVVVRLWRCVWVLEKVVKLIARRPRSQAANPSTEDMPVRRT